MMWFPFVPIPIPADVLEKIVKESPTIASPLIIRNISSNLEKDNSSIAEHK